MSEIRCEAHLRRVAARQGLQLMKSHARDPRALGYATYQICDPILGVMYTGKEGRDSGYGLTLEDVAEQLGEVES